MKFSFIDVKVVLFVTALVIVNYQFFCHIRASYLRNNAVLMIVNVVELKYTKI